MDEINENLSVSPDEALTPFETPAVDLKAAKRCFSRLGFGLLAALVVGSLLQIFCLGVLTGYYGDANAAPSWAFWVASFVPLYCVGVPVGLLIMRRVPADPVPKGPLGAGRFLRLFPISVCLMYAGNLAGIGVTSLLGELRGEEVANPLLGLAMEESVALRFLVMAVLAPIVEEFVFRKTLIDRMRPYGERLALATSALVFGLYHGNLSQFFYAAALGALFGYVYLKTGRLRYTVALHMFINALGSVVAPLLLELPGVYDLEEVSVGELRALLTDAPSFYALVAPGILALVAYALLMFLLAALGLVLLLVSLGDVCFDPAPMELPKGGRFRTVWCNAGMILLTVACLGLFAYSVFG